MKPKTIWLINAYAMPPDREQRIQTLKRAQYLQKNGYDVYIIGGSYLHNTKINLINDKSDFIKAEYDGLKFIHIKTLSYYNNSFLRVYSLILFYLRLYKVSSFIEKPDVISLYAAVPFSNIVFRLAKRLKAKLVIDVVDLWPESFVALGLVSKNNPLLWLAYLSEKWIYKKADAIIFSMEGGENYLIEKGWDKESGGPINLNKVNYINNGVDLGDFNMNKNLYTLNDKDLEDDSIFKVVYLGSIRLANGVDLILEAAKYLNHIKEIKFLIYGNGPERIILEKRIQSEGISNVIFKQEWVDLKYVPFVLTKSSLNLLNYSKNPIFRYGGSQSKSFQYMASGKPICSNIEMAYCPIKKFNIGIAKNFKSAEEYAQAILEIYSLPKIVYNTLCNNALTASKEYDYEHLTNKYIKHCLTA
jgi:glycosyltransferase involved in cell wall biosynthesis